MRLLKSHCLSEKFSFLAANFRIVFLAPSMILGGSWKGMVRMVRRSKATPGVSPKTAAQTPIGGRFAPLDDAGLARIVQAAMDILARTGIAECPAPLAQQMISAGASRRADGRICFPQSMVETAIARASRRVSLPGFVEDMGLTIGGGRVHIGTGG
ncbi:MAG: trimethylamine methyltransferase family protein, partial [Pseudomonadota bacterium]